MLTQLELLSAAGGLDDDDGRMTVSPLSTLNQYPMEQTELEYYESSLRSSYCDLPQSNFRETLPLVPPPATHNNSSGNSLFNAGCNTEDIKPFLDVNAFSGGDQTHTEKMKLYEEVEIKDEIKAEDDFGNYEGFSSTGYDSTLQSCNTNSATINFGNYYDTFDSELHGTEEGVTITRTWEEGPGKGKIGPLQRRALDAIFNVTEKPSRGLVLHIASELGLHHLTVKNFFSNGRRRLRRAAARLNDPERTRRENERRKEKRRLAAALASAATNGAADQAPTICDNDSIKVEVPQNFSIDPASLKESPPMVSPERRALMEKLADKVQRSVAQRSLAADLDLLKPKPHSFLNQASHDLFSQSAQDILIQPPSDILSQASQDILSQSPYDFIPLASHEVYNSSSQPNLLNSHTDPWNLF